VDLSSGSLYRVYAENLMGPKLLIAMLVMALAGANSGLASLCAAYCMSSTSAGRAVAHPHMDSQQDRESTSQNLHAHRNGAECAECPPTSENSLKQKADCASLDQMQTLKEGSFNLDAPGEAAQVDAVSTPNYTVACPCDGESLVFDASRTILSLPSPSLPLRI
jgi:hypothetical protein